MTNPVPESSCFHCGLPVPANSNWRVTIDGAERAMCCPGCQAVAQAIVDGGLEAYYRQRTEKADTGSAATLNALDALKLFDQPEVQKSFVRDKQDLKEAALILEGIHCAACIWLNEQHLQQLKGVHKVNINYATHRASVTWDNSRIHLSDILQAIQSIGYQAHPYDPSKQQQILEKEKRDYLKRIGLAGVLGMQLMVLAVSMYLGDWTGMESGFRQFFVWLSLLLTAPILAYSARPFLDGALRDLRRLHAGMDVPVSIGILLAFFGSAWNAWTGTGHVYFESVAMFVFFLLSARYLEMQARKHSAETSEALVQSIPTMARLVDDDGDETWVAAATLKPGQTFRANPGEVFAADGVLTDVATSVDESLLTGEHEPVAKRVGDEVIGGSINVGNPALVHITRSGDDTVLSGIVQLVDQAQTGKPNISRLADRAAGWFVSAILLLAILVAVFWFWQGSAAWLAITVSVLVVTCPCALSLATPTAITAAIGVLTRIGLVPASTIALERLEKVTHVLFDKTGTLTLGHPVITAVELRGGVDDTGVRRIAAALERHSMHPIARAFSLPRDEGPAATDIEHIVAGGIRGSIDGRRYCIGSREFVGPDLADDASVDTASRIYLAEQNNLLAVFTLSDGLRPEAQSLIQALAQRGLHTSIVSGDHESGVRAIADTVGVDEYRAGYAPTDKLEHIRQLQEKGATVMMVGDGINDAPVLAAADISVAMGEGAQLAMSRADFILMSGSLSVLVDGLNIARRTMRIIRQNLAWAVVYNLSALPLAAAGMVPPWLAALGMSTSSLVVVLNALRLTRYKQT